MGRPLQCKWSFDSLIGDQRSIIVWPAVASAAVAAVDDDEVVAREQQEQSTVNRQQQPQPQRQDVCNF
ncbi:hypothetical protein ACLKA6_005488 [Drosophila palustris]